MKDLQATGEAFSTQSRKSNTLNMNFIDFFLFECTWVGTSPYVSLGIAAEVWGFRYRVNFCIFVLRI
jgi:hypothetical protein